MIGSTISHYRITAKLGAGGMGDVYLATDTHLDRQVAIKFLAADRASDPDARQRFLHEAKAQAMLSHPHIATFLDVGEDGGRPYLVMEYVEGQSLRAYALETERSLPEIIDLVTQVGEGLIAAQEHGITHRDIKPENILVTPKGQVKITDFGLARWKGATTLTQEGSRMGTAYYMSPEQAEGKRGDHRSDIFALGVILYELVCRQRPFEGDTDMAILYDLMSTDPPPLARFSRTAPDELQRIVSKCLAKDPAERYQSAADFVVDLRMLPKTETLKPKPKPRSRSRTLLFALLGGLTILAIGVAFYIGKSGSGSKKRTLAVLPFENIGGPGQEEFADGLTEEIIGRLGSIKQLSPLSRTAVQSYKNTTKSVPEIARELRVDYLMEGSVRWALTAAGSYQLRITASLVQADNASQLWSETYDKLMSDALAIQVDIGQRVVDALGIEFFEDERENLARGGTKNPKAYQACLIGNARFIRALVSGEVDSAIAAYSEAVHFDTNYAIAYAKLSRLHARAVWYGDVFEAHAHLAKACMERATELDPKSPETQLARGYYYYWVETDYERALAEFEPLIESGAGSSVLYEVYAASAYVMRRLGNFEQSLARQHTALEQDPELNVVTEAGRFARRAGELAKTYLRMRDWSHAEQFAQQARRLAPEAADPYITLARIQVYGFGNPDSAWSILVGAPRSIPPKSLSEEKVFVSLLRRDARSAHDHLMIATDTSFYYLERAAIDLLLQNHEGARGSLDTARVILERDQAADPTFAAYHSYLGIAYAGLGRLDDAIRSGKEAVNLLRQDKDEFWYGPRSVEALARIYATIGDKQAAVVMLDSVLALPAGQLTPAYLKIAPEYDPLRGYAAFDSLVTR